MITVQGTDIWDVRHKLGYRPPSSWLRIEHVSSDYGKVAEYGFVVYYDQTRPALEFKTAKLATRFIAKLLSARDKYVKIEKTRLAPMTWLARLLLLLHRLRIWRTKTAKTKKEG